jgi:hypothetical protein
MANPLATIRKYDKYLLAVFGVLLMVAFLIDDSLMSLITGQSRRGGGANVPGKAVSFKGGSLNEGQLSVMHVAENAAFDVMRRVYTETIAKKKTPREFPIPSPSGSEYELVHKMLLAQKAHELGLSLSDADIDRLLKQVSDETLTDADLKKIRNEVLSGYRASRIAISEKDIYAQLRTNFLAQEMLALLRSSTKMPQGAEGEIFDLMSQQTPRMKVTPAQAWNYFRRMNRKVRAEVLPLEVEKFIDQVKGEPTSAQKDELFEKYKNVVPNPASPEPGFASPHKIAFGYVRIDFDKYLEEEKAKVTEEQLRAEYDKRVEAGDFRVPVLPEEKKDDTEKEEPKAEDAKPEEKPKAEEPKAEEPKAEEPKAEEPKSADEAKPAEEKPAEEKSAEEESSSEEDELTDDSSAEPEAASEEAAEADAKEAKPETKPEASETKSEPKAEEKPAAAEEKPEDKPSEEPAKNEDKSDEKASSDEEKKPEPKKPETRVRTFDEVKDDLRAQLARKPAQDKQEAAVKEVEQVVRAYGAKYREWDFARKQAEQSKKKQAKLPEKPELAPRLRDVVKKYGLSFKQLDLLDRYEVAQEELGSTSFFNGRGFSPFSQMYDLGLGLFEPAQVGGDLRDVTYVFWKEQDQEAKPAERKDVEDQIVHAWKMDQAYELALAKAKELAAQARDKESLRAAFPDGVEKAGAVQETSPFSWLTTGSMPFGMAAPELSRVPEVPYAGEEFMQTVMDLKPGEVGATADQPHKTVYVVRVISQTPDEKALRELFLSQGVINPNMAFQYASDRAEQLQTWMSNLEKDMQLTWYRPPQPFQR